MAYALSFAPEFFWGDGSIELGDMPRSDRPTCVFQAILSLPNHQRAALVRDLFDCKAADLDPVAVLCKVQETNTCRNLDSPVEVFIDSDGFYTVFVHELKRRKADERIDDFA